MNYRFVEPGQAISFKREGVHIGNAVPVRLGYIIGKSIMEHIKEACKNGGQQSVYI